MSEEEVTSRLRQLAAEQEETPDQFVGRVFRDLDPRSVGRRVQVITKTRSRFGHGVYRVIHVNAHGRPVGRSSRLSRHQLETEYEQEGDGAMSTTTHPVPTSDIKRMTDELRDAAEELRGTIRQLRTLRPGSPKLSDLIAKHKAMGFSRAPVALAVADLLEEHADDAWISGEKPSGVSLAVARLIVGAVR